MSSADFKKLDVTTLPLQVSAGVQVHLWLAYVPAVETHQEEASTGDLTQHPAVVCQLIFPEVYEHSSVTFALSLSDLCHSTASVFSLKHTYSTASVRFYIKHLMLYFEEFDRGGGSLTSPFLAPLLSSHSLTSLQQGSTGYNPVTFPH